ncbi:MAG: NADH-quinone oxidoreductase subunit D [Candidatus Marinimicrobia bacterium]|nr:NADH-quinone oxidoreductase subunit D [Candidatus Neomarinimicrobiota bacterium]
MFTPDRSKYPEIVDGKAVIDLDSGKYLKLWQGPQHPGVTGNMSLELIVCGDEVVDCKTHVGYLHRGFEKLMERRKFIQNFPIVCRICVPEPDTNEYLYAAAVEEVAGIKIPEQAKWLRTLNMEMSRLTSYLMWIGGHAGAFGLGPIGQWAVTHRDYMLDLFEEWTGGRVYHMYMIPGGVRNILPDGFDRRLEDTLQKIEKLMSEIEKVMLNNAVFKMRAVGLGIITKDMIDRYGVVGPIARAAGMKRDVRKNSPYLMYEHLDFDIITGTKSDAYERLLVRFREMFQSIDLIRQIMKYIDNSKNIHTKLPNVLHWKIPAGETYVKAESTRGEYGYFVVTDGSELPRRVYVRGPSYSHAVALLEDLIINVNIADVAGLMTSLHTYPPEIER